MAAKEITISSGFSDDDSPSRCELLSMVRKHSRSLVEARGDDEETSDVEMDSRFWNRVFDLYFVRGRVSKGREEDDMIFFVKNMSMDAYGFNDSMEGAPPFFVRRWAPELEKVFGENPTDVDWRRSFFLNLIAHTSFSVTVAICSIQDLRKHQEGENLEISPIYKVVKTVYASPSRVNFQLDFKKAVETLPAYPNICFAVDDFDDTFDAVVLTETDHCYCVLLNAHGGAALPAESGLVDNDRQAKKAKITLFSGFVSYPMIREAYEAGRSRFGSFLSIGHSPAKTDRIYMRGPGGRGEVEVAVSGIADQSHQISGPPSPLQLSKKGLGIGLGTVVHKAAEAASVLAKQAYAAASSTRKSDVDLIPLKCCLMSIALPWDYIAHDLLFKENPPVNM
ncbi:uncharacterized protein KIAA0930 homolog isoform X1 [Dioscorea cayenensis subsp. rotundata]|uniref:Uncharacterized protein KIAA0930 homolog isoform X1 n=2 Tax=Dioscorea cayennensis subsp. rotundata TaxID=55577 RepID=A0AB40CMW3_DIOCR|nr:uncharacterized protein KIAA0930 homolog isoform X1 [Dioscorea cayenensis subsp. rotundata]